MFYIQKDDKTPPENCIFRTNILLYTNIHSSGSATGTETLINMLTFP